MRIRRDPRCWHGSCLASRDAALPAPEHRANAARRQQANKRNASMQKALTSLAPCAAAAGPAHALELTANGGFMTEYIFREIPQDDSSAMGGLDLRHAGLYGRRRPGTGDDLLGDPDGDSDADDDNSVVLTVSKTFTLFPQE
jgi:hypothetical protein